MTDSVTSSAIAAGDTDGVRRQETAVDILFRPPERMTGPVDPKRALARQEVADYPSIGAVAVIELARAESGWQAMSGAKNGLAAYEKFAALIRSSGWFKEVNTAAVDQPDFSLDNPVGSLKTIAAKVYPHLGPADQVRAAAAMIRSLSHALGPDGVPAETIKLPEGRLGKPEVLERRVTTVASHALSVGDAPQFDMHWLTEVFTRTKDGKDDPKNHTDRHPSNHHFVFDVARWKSGDRSAVEENYRRVEDWLDDMTTSGGRTKAMPCFDAIV